MRRASSIIRPILTIVTWLTLAVSAQQSPSLRTWTDVQGRKVEASFGGLKDTSVQLILKDGKVVPFPLAQLSPEDQAFAKSQPAPIPAPSASASASASSSRLPPEKRSWPDKVEVATRTMEKLKLVAEEPQNRKYIYQTDSFEFVSQDKLAGSVMTEIARTFEATRLLVASLPWGVVCNPPPPLERYQAAFYETREDYFNNGGPQNSGGVYDSGDMIFKIPFPSLGLERRGKTWFKNENFRNDTLVHEITHQVMHDYLQFLPKWVIEGTAEYTEMIPNNAGTFRLGSHKSGVKEHAELNTRNGNPIDLGSIKEHLTMNREQWDTRASDSYAMRTLYLRSALLVYYFNHLDGTGKGERFIDFFESVYGDVQALHAFFANPNVKRMPGGRFSYPTSLTPPDMNPLTAPFKHINKLLADRDYSKIAAEIVEGYRAIGIKVIASE
jgi:SLA1 homology domain 1, SHD1